MMYADMPKNMPMTWSRGYSQVQADERDSNASESSGRLYRVRDDNDMARSQDQQRLGCDHDQDDCHPGCSN